jgi:alpha/beta superfamily hydrolase
MRQVISGKRYDTMRSLSRIPTLCLLVVALAVLGALQTACAPSAAATTPTPLSATATARPEPGTFYFTTEDGVTLSGKTYGQGTTAIVLSSMDGDTGADWDQLVEPLANRGYLVMTYNYRGLDPSQGAYIRGQLDRDLRAAVGVVRARGATSVALMGASLGGLVTLKGAATEQPKAVVILSAPASYQGLSLSASELNAITAPKFFAVSRQDSFYGAMQGLYDEAPAPKLLQVYPGRNHGVDLFLSSDTKDDFLSRLFAFLQSNAPA